MTKGRLGAIVCPMLEDELIYNLKSDPESKRICLVNNAFMGTIIPKLKQHKVEYELVSQTEALSNTSDDGYTVYIWMMFMGLHEDINILNMEMMNQILTIFRSVDTIMLYYGRCGRALDNICQWASVNIPIPVEIFRNKDGTLCDDCICIPVGGTDRYLNLLRTHPGRIYLTPAMASNFEGFLASMELFNGLDTNNTEIMQMMLDMAGYTEALELQTGIGDQEHFHDNIDKFTKKYNLKWGKLDDEWASKDITDMNYANAKRLMTRWVDEGINENKVRQ